MTEQLVRTDRQGRVGILILDRPRKLNALNRAMVAQVTAALDTLAADPGVGTILLRGEGRAFSAGFDLFEENEPGFVPAEATRRMMERDYELILKFWDCPKPVVASVHGACLGGAFELMLACDVAVAAEDARLGEPEAKIGSSIVAMLLPWIAGPRASHEILLTGMDRLDARRALDLGIVNRVVPAEALAAASLALADEIAAASRQAVAATRRALKRTYDRMGFREAMREALEIAIAHELDPGPDQAEFDRIRAEEGLEAAMAWRNDAGRVG